MVIKIVSGWSNPGGSTEAFIQLTNLFNSSGYEAIFYGPHEYHLDYCSGGRYLGSPTIKPEDHVISHYYRFPNKINSKKHILSCHETTVFPLAKFNLDAYNGVHMVSKLQKQWHGFLVKPVTIIPNVLADLKPNNIVKNKLCSAIIGSIDHNKQTHVSIERSIKDGIKPYLFGAITDRGYFEEKVRPFIDSGLAEYKGVVQKELIYDNFAYVYHSSLHETFNYIKAECELTHVQYLGLPSAESGASYWNKQDILNAWKLLLEL